MFDALLLLGLLANQRQRVPLLNPPPLPPPPPIPSAMDGPHFAVYQADMFKNQWMSAAGGWLDPSQGASLAARLRMQGHHMGGFAVDPRVPYYIWHDDFGQTIFVKVV